MFGSSSDGTRCANQETDDSTGNGLTQEPPLVDDNDVTSACDATAVLNTFDTSGGSLGDAGANFGRGVSITKIESDSNDDDDTVQYVAIVGRPGPNNPEGEATQGGSGTYAYNSTDGLSLSLIHISEPTRPY